MKFVKSLFNSAEKKKIVIKKDGMEEMEKFKKQCWISILCLLEMDTLEKVATVCKEFFFILKENDRFWKLYVEKNYKEEKNLPKDCKNWKEFYLTRLRIGWDFERMDAYFHPDPLDPLHLSTRSSSGTWKSCISKNFLIEGYLYPFLLTFPNRFLFHFFFFFYSFFIFYKKKISKKLKKKKLEIKLIKKTKINKIN